MTTRNRASAPRRTLAASLLGFFIITLDALVLSVALPSIRASLGGGISGLQWVMDGYTLPFAALLLLAGTLADRSGSRRAFGLGLILFVLSSAACAMVPSLGWLIAARVMQGAAAAFMTPASLALIGEAYPDPREKARAIGIWATGGAVASAAGPLVGGALTAISWQLIFLINIPIGALALGLLRGVPESPHRPAALDPAGQIIALVALTALTFGVIEAGEVGLGQARAYHPLLLAMVAALAWVAVERRVASPMVPFSLFRRRAASTAVVVGFSFMAAFFGMVFAMSLFFQEARGLGPVQAGLAFLPVTGLSIFAPILAARFGERFGAWAPISLGLAEILTGLVGLVLLLPDAPTPVLVGLMMLLGIGGGTAMPSATSLLLNTVPPEKSGTASGVLNTARQVGGLLAIALFGALITARGYDQGLRLSLALAAGLVLLTLLAAWRLRPALSPHAAAEAG